LSLPRSAAAAVYDVCAQYGVDFDDADAAVGDDHITTAGDLPARGAWMEVKIAGSSTIVASGFAMESGADIGCLQDVTASGLITYTVKLYSTAEIGGNTVDIRKNGTDNVNYTTSWAWHPGGGTKVTFATALDDQWNIAAAAGFAASRLDGGLSGETWRWYTEDCPTGSESCIAYNTGDTLWVGYGCHSSFGTCGSDPFKRKYLIAHQMGHLASIFKNGDLIAAVSTTAAADGACDGGTGHSMHSKEHQSSAAYEGIAHAWAALAFNDSGAAADCGFSYYLPPDWDNDGTPDPNEFDCDGTLYGSIDGNDYLNDVCGGTLTGKGTEIDWLRFWWDLVTDGGLNDAQIFEIWAGASPDDWSTDGTGPPGAQPAKRLLDSADFLSLFTQWDAYDDANGVQR
jgi:hypothetical protein